MAFQLAFIAILLILEKTFPRSKKAINLKNSFWFFTNFLILGYLIPKISSAIEALFGHGFTAFLNLQGTHFFIQFLTLLILSDFLRFVSHYVFHKFDFLWLFHSVHHSSEDIDTLASFKHSWVEALANIALSSLILQFVRTEVSVLIAVNMTFLYVCIWQHANINFKKFQLVFLKRIFITPSMHRKHHELAETQQHRNLGFIFSFWDQIFQSYSEIDATHDKYGINTPGYPHHSNLRQFFYPILPSNRVRMR